MSSYLRLRYTLTFFSNIPKDLRVCFKSYVVLRFKVGPYSFVHAVKGLFWLLGTDVREDRASDLFTYFLYPAIWKSFFINYSLLESRSFRFSKYNPVTRKRESIFFHFLLLSPPPSLLVYCSSCHL